MADKESSSPSSTGNPVPVKSVWGVPLHSQVQAPSLSDVMDEQMASDLQEKEERSELKKIVAQIRETAGDVVEVDGAFADLVAEDADDDQCTDDLLIAQMLQLQFDQEYDEALKREMNHVNGSSKLTISYSKYQRIPLPFWVDESDDDDADPNVDDDAKRDVDSYETADKELGQIPRCGYKKIGGQIVTKHDREISERSNGRRMMEFPPGIETGDGAATNGPQIAVSNAVYNKIRNFSIKEGKRKKRVNDKIDKSTAEQAFDPATRLILFKMINNGIIESVHGILSTGKEAVIVFADGGPGPDDAEVPMNIPKELAIKIFKTTLNEFKNRDKYIKDDYRFRDRFSKQNPRKVIHMWAEKEMHNLMKMSKFGIPVPEVILLKKHILVMSFIGDDGEPAPKLKDACLSDAEVELAYAQTVETMTRLYNDVHLVHADLSEYNILWHEGQCWYIDVSQAVEPNHPHGLEFLYRDCKNVSDFFTAKGVHQCLSPAALFTSITGLPIDETGSEAEILTQVLNFLKHEDLLSGNTVDDVDGFSEGSEHKIDAFDYCWNQSKLPRTPAKPIPGHSKPKSGSSSGPKSPRSPKSPKSPRSSFFGAKSPKTPPNSTSSFAGMSDEDLKNLKDEMVRQTLDSELGEDGKPASGLPRKESQVKFNLDEADASASDKK